MSEENEADAAYYGCHFTLAGVTARAFDADYHNVSVSGITLQGMTGIYDRETYYDSEPSWDFARYVPDVVVMNLGANDINSAGEMLIRRRYVDMLDRLRQAHPDAHIVVFNGWGWDFDEPADYTAEVVADYGDSNVSVATFPWVFEQWHGAEYDHGGMARYLIAHLEETLGWEAGEPHLMSGYGWEGDVANGSLKRWLPLAAMGGATSPRPGLSESRSRQRLMKAAHFFASQTAVVSTSRTRPRMDRRLRSASGPVGHQRAMFWRSPSTFETRPCGVHPWRATPTPLCSVLTGHE